MTHDALLDDLAIRKLVARAMISFDRGDEQTWIQCWSPDAVFHVNGKVAAGPEGLLTLFRAIKRPIHHLTADSVIEIGGDSATHECSLVTYAPSDSGPVLRVHGYYQDHLIRLDSGWVLKSREMTPVTVASSDHPQPVLNLEPRVDPVIESPLGMEHMFVSQRFERVLGVTATLAQSPELARRFHEVGQYFVKESAIAPRTREIVILRMAWLTSSEYEFGVHVLLGRRAGLSNHEITALTKPLAAVQWTPQDLAVIAMTDQMYLNDKVSDETWASVAREYDAKEMVDLVLLAGFFRMSDTFLNVLRVAQEPGIPGGYAVTAEQPSPPE